MKRKQMSRLCSSQHRIPKKLYTHCGPCIPSRRIFSLPGLNSKAESERYHERKILPYKAYELYNIVSDVDRYHRFLPYCSASRVLERHTSKSAEGGEILKMQGELTVGFMGFMETYKSNIECKPYEMVQATASSEMPLFKSLLTTWRFQPASSNSPHPTADLKATLQQPVTHNDGPTLVTLDLAYEFANPIYAQLSAMFFKEVSKMMVTAFEKRCLEVYGPGTR